MGIGYNTSVVRDGLVLYLDAANSKSYPGSGATFFNLGSSADATLVNGPTYSSNNKGYFTLDGVNDFINTNTDSYNVAQTITYEFVMKASVVSANKVLIGKYDGAAPDMWMGITGLNQKFTADYYGLASSFPITDNQFRHYTVSYNSVNLTTKLYINGELNHSNLISARSNPRGNLMIGRFGTGSSFYFPADIAFVKIYNIELSENQVKQNFEATRGRYGI
jgi:hypothetical protein